MTKTLLNRYRKALTHFHALAASSLAGPAVVNRSWDAVMANRRKAVEFGVKESELAAVDAAVAAARRSSAN